MLKQVLSDIYQIDFVDLNLLECGAYRADSLISSEFIQNNNCWYLEPNPEYFNNIINSGLKQCLNYALSDFNGEVDFYKTTHPGNSSIDHSEIHRKELESYGSTFSKIKVECITYSTLIQKVDCIFDIFCLDVEGHEMKVLKSMEELSSEKMPKIIVIECGYDWNDRLEVLESMGYSIDIYWQNNCILSKNDKNIQKNKNKIQYYNNIYREFIWFGRVIYKNPFSL
jgi:FkbM family methyltransferase